MRSEEERVARYQEEMEKEKVGNEVAFVLTAVVATLVVLIFFAGR